MDKNQKDLKTIIEDIKMTPDQGKAINEYLANYINEWKEKIEEKIYNDVNKQLVTEYNSKAKKFEKNLRASLTEELSAEIKGKLKKELTESYKEKFEETINEGIETLNEYYETKFNMFCQEATKEIEETLKEELHSSPETKAFNSIVGAVQPFVDMSDNVKYIEILEKQDRTIRNLAEKYNALNKEKTISELIVLLPEEHQESVRELLEESETAEDAVKKFEKTCEFLKNTSDILETESIDKGIKRKKDSLKEDVWIEDDIVINDELLEDIQVEKRFPKKYKKVDYKNIIEEDYFDDEIETVTSSIEDEDEGINEGEANSKKSNLTESQERIKYLYNVIGL